MSVSHSSRPPGCWAIQRSERSTTPSNGGPGHRPAEREIYQPYLRPPHSGNTPVAHPSLQPMRHRQHLKSGLAAKAYGGHRPKWGDCVEKLLSRIEREILILQRPSISNKRLNLIG